MNFIKDKVYREAMNVLKNNQEMCQKIPQEVLAHIEKHAKKASNMNVEALDEISIAKLSDDAFSLYLSLYLRYVAEGEEKERLKKKLIENEIKFKQKMKK